jgi:hypothetical protein
MLRIFPLLLVPIILYALLAGGHGVAAHFGNHLAGQQEMQIFLAKYQPIPVFSGATWNFSLGDALQLLSLLMLFFEIIKATRTTRRELLNHGLSAVTFVVALVLFITTQAFSTSVFFFIMVMTAFDTVAGYTIGIVAAEHDLGMGRAGTD